MKITVEKYVDGYYYANVKFDDYKSATKKCNSVEEAFEWAKTAIDDYWNEKYFDYLDDNYNGRYF